MAGGRGTRLGALTDSVPKPLMPLGTTTPLDLVLALLSEAGCGPVIVSVGYLGELIEAHLHGEGYLHGGITSVRDPEGVNLGTAGPLTQLEDRSGQLVVSNADIFCPNLDIKDLVFWHADRRAAITVSYREQTAALPYGVLALDVEGRIVGIEEKPIQTVRAIGGVYVIDLDAVGPLLPREPARLDMPDLIEAALGHGLICFGYRLPEPWIDLGTPEQIREATAYLLERHQEATR